MCRCTIFVYDLDTFSLPYSKGFIAFYKKIISTCIRTGFGKNSTSLENAYMFINSGLLPQSSLQILVKILTAYHRFQNYDKIYFIQ